MLMKQAMIHFGDESDCGGTDMDSYEMRELSMFRKQMEDVERLPLAERKANAVEWFKDLSDNYMMVAERVGWLLNGSYGKGSHDSACRVVNSPRMNQVAWCAITIANLEWRCPAKMAIMAWKKLPVETRYLVNEAIRREIADAKREGYCGEIKKNPRRRYSYDHTTGEGQRRLMYESAGLPYISSRIDTSKSGDYGADPIGSGMFRMVPSGDIVSASEKTKRLKRS